MKVLSFDCGHESLGVALLEFFPHHLIAINDILTKTVMDTFEALGELDRLTPHEQKALVNHIMGIIHMIIDHFDKLVKTYFMVSAQLIKGNVRQAGIIERATAIKSFLSRIDAYCKQNTIAPDVVLIEDQTINNLSGEVAAQVSFFYTDLSKDYVVFPQSQYDIFDIDQQVAVVPSIVIIHPKYKNLLRFSPRLGIEHFYGKYVNLYDANKNHTKSNFVHWMKHMDPSDEYTCTYRKKTSVGVPSKRKRDIADAFMQSMAYMVFMQHMLTVSSVKHAIR